MSDPVVALRSNPLFSLLADSSLEDLVRQSQIIAFRPKRPVLREGQPSRNAFVLLEGTVRVFHRRRDREILVKLFGAPAFFGEMEVLTGRPFLENVTTLSPSRVLAIPNEVLSELVSSQPAFSAALLRDLCARLCIATCNERAIAFEDVQTRLANVLLDYASLWGAPTEQGIRIDLKLTQEGLARDLAVTRKAISMTLGKFQKLRVLSRVGGRFHVQNMEALRKLSSEPLGLAYRLQEKP
jgi:CRP-like cAMP-binding protein